MALSGTEATTAIDMARLIVGLTALGVASLTDLRTRKVPNALWYIMATVGVGLLLADLSQLEGAGAWHLALALPVAGIFAVVVTGGELWPVMPEDEEDPGRELTPEEERVYKTDLAVSAAIVAASIAVLVLAYGHMDDKAPFWYVVSSVMMVLLALGLYLMRALHGGGDAKALMTLAVLFPIHPLEDPLPILALPAGFEVMFPFSLSVLIDAAIITALAPLAFIAISAKRGPLRFPEAVFGHPVDIEAVEDGRMWLLYEAKEGEAEVRRKLWPGRSKASEEARRRALGILKDRGESRVYVSPKIPFMVPMLAGLMMAAVIGNIVMGLVWAAFGG